MSKFKEAALKDINIDTMYDVFTDSYLLRRTKPAEHMQLRMYKHQYENSTVADIHNMFDYTTKHQEDYVNLGPTNRELHDPRIRHAWEELQILRKLIGTQYER